MKFQKGFIQISILIVIAVGVIAIGGTGYVVVGQYQKHKKEDNIQQQKSAVAQKEQATSTTTNIQELSEIEKLRQEVETLKKQRTSSPKPQLVSTTLAKRIVLSNSEIIKKAKPATVYIETTQNAGSGMIIDVDGYILTNAHVVSGDTIVSVKLSDGRVLSASVIGRDEIIDLAILKVGGNNFPKINLGDSDLVIQGDEVFTLGYPFGLEGDVSFKEGTISRKLIDEGLTYLETSAEIHPGNSGGPLVNKYGEVVGVNTANIGNTIKGISVGETIKLAIPINDAKVILSELKNGRQVLQPKLAVVTETLPPPPKPTCVGNLSELQRIGNGTYSLYSLYGYDPYISMESNEMKLTGIVKNNSTCVAHNVKLKVTISDSNNPSLTQEEIITLRRNTADYLSPTLTINPSISGEYKGKITVFSNFTENVYGYTSIIGKILKGGINVYTQIVSAEWLPSN